MKAVDTNILARFILADDERQSAMASDILSAPVWVGLTVWLELGWVLATRAALGRAIVADAIETLLQLRTIHTADRDGLAWAVARYRAGADWADMIHLVSARSVADGFVTFDRGIAPYATQSPLPVETLI
ncbi:type II toxin-antitoxin system VapC family toxin [Sphingomonas sp. 4RDLI-65]|uniref:type II toxin-antitoxin system VapC family toxin n=1 Tax=Sphingomonas sp. 4RDLI-65 TaxID=3111641 RepID=UPI003C21F1D5